MEIPFALVIAAGAILIIAGCAGLLWCNRNSFHRRNALGMEEFESFGKLMLFRITESTVIIISIIAILGGIIVLFWKLVGFAVLGPDINDKIEKVVNKFK